MTEGIIDSLKSNAEDRYAQPGRGRILPVNEESIKGINTATNAKISMVGTQGPSWTCSWEGDADWPDEMIIPERNMSGLKVTAC